MNTFSISYPLIGPFLAIISWMLISSPETRGYRDMSALLLVVVTIVMISVIILGFSKFKDHSEANLLNSLAYLVMFPLSQIPWSNDLAQGSFGLLFVLVGGYSVIHHIVLMFNRNNR